MHKYIVSGSQQLTPTTLLLTLKKGPKDSRPFIFRPGQYAVISFWHRGRPTAARCFSVVSSPTELGILQFSMRVDGRFTRALTKLAPGDTVKVRGPFGGFVFDARRDADTVLLAGGIGITPFMSMIRYAAASNLSNRMTLLYSCSNQEDVPFAEELMALERANPLFKTIYFITRGATDKFNGFSVAKSRITPEIIDYVVAGDYDRKTFFICGPNPFMKNMDKILIDKGISDDRIISEAFSQGPNRQTGEIRSWPLNVYVLSAVSVVLGSFLVMVSDLIKTLPPSSLLSSLSDDRLENLTNSRQSDLDSLVNGITDFKSSNPASNAVNSAGQPTATATNNQSTALPTANSATNNSTATPTATTPVTTAPTNTKPAVTPVPVVKPAPVPVVKPPPKCTTTQSGITTCV